MGGQEPVISVESSRGGGSAAVHDVFLFSLHLKCAVSPERERGRRSPPFVWMTLGGWRTPDLWLKDPHW